MDRISIVSGKRDERLDEIVKNINKSILNGKLSRPEWNFDVNIQISFVPDLKFKTENGLEDANGFTLGSRTKNPRISINSDLSLKEQVDNLLHEVFEHGFSRIKLNDKLHNKLARGQDISEFSIAELEIELKARMLSIFAAKDLGLSLPPREVDAIDRVVRVLEDKNWLETQKQKCFLAGTPIQMADGTQKAIERILPGDSVMAFDPRAGQGLGPAVPRKVTRVFRNTTRSIVDLRGVRMTPGHVVLSDNGEWLKIVDVLRGDRAIVEEREGGAVLVRARTGCRLDAPEDVVVTVLVDLPGTGTCYRAAVRAGIPFDRHESPDGPELWTLARALSKRHKAILERDGTIVTQGGQRTRFLNWPGTLPLVSRLTENFIVSIDDEPFMPRWISDLAEDEAVAVNSGSWAPPSAAARPLNRAERRRQTALRVVR